MTTLEDALVTLISTNYSAGGGAKPTNIVNINAYQSAKPFSRDAEWIIVWRERQENREPFNDNYADVFNELHVYVMTPTSDDRLKEIMDEVIVVINGFAITGVNQQYAKKSIDTSERTMGLYRGDITAFFISLLVESTIAYGATGSSPTYYTKAEVDALIAAYVAQLSFKTITGITNNVVADAVDDTLTLASGNNRLTIVGTTATDTITFTVDESKINHDALTNFAASEHFTMLDEDNMASNSDTQAATQQSVKAYVDAQVGSENEINEMNDVVLAGPANNDILVYEAVDGSWHDWSPDEYEILLDHDKLINFTATEHFTMLDEDNFASNSNTQAATQQSIKAYTDGAIDIDIATHAAIAAAHHARYTDLEVENIITAELVNGQSIDNAIDTLIATHALVVAAHHTRYTDLEAADVITEKLADGESIDNAIDALIAAKTDQVLKTTSDVTFAKVTGTGLATFDSIVPEADLVDELGTSALTWKSIFVQDIYDDDGVKCAYTNSDTFFYVPIALYAGGVAPTGDLLKYIGSAAATWKGIYVENIYDDDGTLCAFTNSDGTFRVQSTLYIDGDSVNSALMLGSANAAWIPLVPEDRGDFSTTTGSYVPAATGTKYLLMNLPYPTLKGALKLYVAQVMTVLVDADANDYMSHIYVLGITSAGYTSLADDATDRDSIGDHIYNPADIDCSSYDRIQVQANFSVNATADLKVGGIFLQCYYA